jgi:hypothetical protein
MPGHHVLHDASGAGIIGLMHHRVRAVENRMIRVRSFDPNAGFVAGDNFGSAKDGFRFLGLDCIILYLSS